MIRGKITYCLASVAIVSMLVISGCVSEKPEGTPAPTGTPTTVPTVTVIPVPTQQTGSGVEILNAPTTAIAGKSFDVVWRVNSPSEKSIPHTAVHFGPQSQSEPLTLSSYPSLTTAQTGTIPANFSAKIIINSTGTTYFRAHAIVDGTNYWSQERTIMISSSTVNVIGTPTVTMTGSSTVTMTPRSTGGYY